MYSHIIVPFDGEEPARRAAGLGADLSRLFDSRLVVMTATPTGDGPEVRALKDRAQQMSAERVDVWIEPNDDPGDAIVTTVRFRPRSLICMATSARQGVRRKVYGSVAESVISAVDVPVLLVGPNVPGGHLPSIRQLVVCMDGSASSESVLPLAAQWSRALDVPCTLLHVAPIEDDATHRRAPDLESLGGLLERMCPRVDIRRHRTSDVTTGILDHLTPASHALALMATHGQGSRRGGQVLKVVERCALPVLVERAGVKRPLALPA